MSPGGPGAPTSVPDDEHEPRSGGGLDTTRHRGDGTQPTDGGPGETSPPLEPCTAGAVPVRPQPRRPAVLHPPAVGQGRRVLPRRLRPVAALPVAIALAAVAACPGTAHATRSPRPVVAAYVTAGYVTAGPVATAGTPPAARQATARASVPAAAWASGPAAAPARRARTGPGRPAEVHVARAASRPWTLPLTDGLVLALFLPPAVRWGPGHRGVDLATAPGSPVLAPADGTVAFAGNVVDRGVLTVTHAGGLRSSVEPVTPLVAVDAVVEQGQPVATVSGTPGHCRPRTCLHWGVRGGDGYVDPLDLLGPETVVLLPVPVDR